MMKGGVKPAIAQETLIRRFNERQIRESVLERRRRQRRVGLSRKNKKENLALKIADLIDERTMPYPFRDYSRGMASGDFYEIGL